MAVRYGMADVDVEVEGDTLGDAIVELAHDWPGPSQALNDEPAQVVRFEVAGGLPSGLVGRSQACSLVG